MSAHSPGPWRVGRKVGRTVYDANDRLIGVMDTAEDAALAVAAPELLDGLKDAHQCERYGACRYCMLIWRLDDDWPDEAEARRRPTLFDRVAEERDKLLALVRIAYATNELPAHLRDVAAAILGPIDAAPTPPAEPTP